MTTHSFNFEGGEELSKIGATWFVSYAYWDYIDKSHTNWTKVKTYPSRISTYTKTKEYHIFWLQQVLKMNPNQLQTNTIKLDPKTTKEMAREILSKYSNQEFPYSEQNVKTSAKIPQHIDEKSKTKDFLDKWNKNLKYRKVDKNFLDADWWQTATPEDVEAEIAKGADVNAVHYNENYGHSFKVEGEVLSLAVIEAEDRALAYYSTQKKTSQEITLQDVKTSEDNIRTLIKHGANVNNIDNYAMRHLFLNTALNILNILIDAGLDVNKTDPILNEKLINMAAQCGQRKIVKRLLEVGAEDTRTFMEKIKTYVG